VISANRIIGPIFYEGTLDAQRYINEILNPFFVNLPPAEERSGYFMEGIYASIDISISKPKRSLIM
jgi:hypothetical protein